MTQKQTKKKWILVPVFSVLFIAALLSCLALSDFFTRRLFQRLTQTIFQKEVTSSTLTLHYTLKNPQTFGITEVPTRYQSTDEQNILTHHYLTLLTDLDSDALSRSDQITYDSLLFLLNQTQNLSQYEYYFEPLGATIGIQAQLPILLCEYRFESATDIRTYLQLLSTTDQYFSSLLAYERQKAARGLFMPSVCADGIIKQCQAFSELPLSEHLLITVFRQKIASAAFLSPEEKQDFLLENRQIVQQHVIPAYQLLVHGLNDLKKYCRNEMGLSHLPKGRSYYEALLQSSSGSALSVCSVQKRIQHQLQEDASACRQILKQYPSVSEFSSEQFPELFSESPDNMLSDLRQKMTADFPAIPDTDYELKYVDASLSPYLSPAFYLTAPVDDPDLNLIYLNPKSGCTGLELYTTLAHEGFPGHLYQNRYSGSFLSPLRSLLSFGGYTEGWATYVEMLSYDYAAKDCSKEVSAAISLAQKQRSMLLGLSSLIDILVHYHGFTKEDIESFLQNLGVSGTATADSIYNAVLESPANYLKYYLGYLTFLDLRQWCQKNWPDQYQLSTFHQYVLEIGPCPFPVLEKYLKLCYTNAL